MAVLTPNIRDKAQVMKKQAFARLDNGRAKTVRVDANALIDLVLAYEEASEGRYEDLEYSLVVAGENIDKMRCILGRIAKIAEPDSEIAQLCYDKSIAGC